MQFFLQKILDFAFKVLYFCVLLCAVKIKRNYIPE